MSGKNQKRSAGQMADHGTNGSRTADGTTPPAQATNTGPPQSVIPRTTPSRVGDQEVSRRDQSKNLDKDTLEHGLGLMAKYIASQRRNLTIIVVGGATNTLLLQDRQYTHNVDLVGTNIDSHQASLLHAAVAHAVQNSPTRLSDEWFNYDVGLVLPLPKVVCDGITREALDQNEVVFRNKGLKVLAAPWKFALCIKLDRISRNALRAYDLSDAVSYLRRITQRCHFAPVPKRTITAWATFYCKQARPNAIAMLAAEYQRQYQLKGIAD